MKKCIYLLEDDPHISYIIQYLLENEGMKVFAFSTIKSLKVALNEELPDLFIFDVDLPDGNGIDLCKEIKTDSKCQAIPILINSANNKLDIIIKDSCADDYVKKPFELDDLLEKIDLLIKK